jgi:hypothetical protein
VKPGSLADPLRLAADRSNLRAMVAPAPKKQPSISTVAAAWAMTLALDAAWVFGLYNYDGEMGDTPPPSLWFIVLSSTVVATVVVGAAWMIWRVFGHGKWPFWRSLIGCIAAKGCLMAALEILSLNLFGPAPFTSESFYRDGVIAITTALVSGSVIGLIIRAIDKPKGFQIDPTTDHFG